ncbi:MAG: hypothetical protein ACSLFD_03555 [Solirubrobacterales bacterium]
MPQLTYTHKVGCSIIGGPVVTDPSLTSILGRIVYGDFCTNRFRTAMPNPDWITDDKPLGTFMPPGRGEQPALNGFGEDEWGRVYAFSDFGEIYRLEQTEVEIKPTRAEIEKWCAEKENKKKPVCVKLNEPTRAERLKKYCSKKKNASKKVCNKKSSKPAKPKQPNQNT